MSDAAHEWTDAELKRLERKMAREYSKAAAEMREKQRKALKKYASEKAAREKALDTTEEALAAHKRWLEGQALALTRNGSIAEQLAKAASQANRKALEALNDTLPTIYAENANRAAFAIDKAVRRDTRFALVDENAVRHLMGLEPKDVVIREVVDDVSKLERGLSKVQSIRKAEFDAAKDIRWNRQKFNSAITQSILQGESIPDIVKRTESIFTSNMNAAFRAARTACTSAENAGRVSSYERAEGMGIHLKQEWLATLDDRTRDSHALLDGEQVEVGERFSNGLRYPGDPTGDPAEVWNCRCTMRAVVEEVEYDNEERWDRLPSGVSYDDWRASHEPDD